MMLADIEARARVARWVVRLIRGLRDAEPWSRSPEARTVGLHVPTEIRARLLREAERHGFPSYSQTVRVALEIGLAAMEQSAPVAPSDVSVRARSTDGATKARWGGAA